MTRREREVMDRLVAGKSAKIIARQLGVSAKTVARYRAKIMTKMEADTVANLAQMAAIWERFNEKP